MTEEVQDLIGITTEKPQNVIVKPQIFYFFTWNISLDGLGNGEHSKKYNIKSLKPDLPSTKDILKKTSDEFTKHEFGLMCQLGTAQVRNPQFNK